MQSVDDAFTAAEISVSRDIAQNLQVAWHLESTLDNVTFTIGVSKIGGNDVIGFTPGGVGSPSNYRYFDESPHVQSLTWERGFNIPQGGVVQGMAEAVLDNTSGRFLPQSMGGHSELFTAIQTKRPIVVSAGFNISGVPDILPQFVGLLNKQPQVDTRNRQVTLNASDYLSYFQNYPVGDTPMYTGITTDKAIEKLFLQYGMSTSQYELDPGLNTIPFVYYDPTAFLSDILNYLVQSENGQLYQDEMGIFRFENRQHWHNSPYTDVQKIVLTGQVIDAQGPADDHIVNVAQITLNTLVKQSGANLYTLISPVTLYPGKNTVAVNFNNPVMQANTPSITANSASDGSGSDQTSHVSITSQTVYSETGYYVLTNNSSSTIYLTAMTITGRQAVAAYDTAQVVETQDNESVTAYQQQVLAVNNPFIQDPIWAASLGQIIVNTFGKPESLQIITIKAMPRLQIGDLISWQGKQWRIWDIKSKLDPSAGFTQDLSLLNRGVPATYFTIGISTIGGTDEIAP